MKWMKKIPYILLGMLSLISLFILACAFSPSLADKVSGLLYANQTPENLPLQEEESAAVMAVSAGISSDGKSLTSDELLSNIEKIGQNTERPVPNKMISEAPEGSSLSVPAQVAGRNGYLPVEESNEPVGEEEAGRLREQNTYGETGDNLTFDTVFYPYYGMLDKNLQKLYRQIYANAAAVNGIFTPVSQVTPGELRNVFMAVFNDHPEIFWLDTAYRGRFGPDGYCAEIALQFNGTADALKQSKEEFQAAADAVLNNAQGSDYEKEVYVHDYLLDTITYDLQAPYNQSAYSALVNGRTVCAGYARAFQYLMRELGIPAYYCTGYAGQSHAWNILKLEEDYYNVDATWDDTDPNTYNYFNQTDEAFAAHHRREDLSVYLPSCNGTKYAGPAEADTRRSLAEAGMAEEQVLTSLSDYYNDCYRKLLEGGGSLTFRNVVVDAGLWMQCYNAYNTDAYSDGYMDDVFEQLNVSSCEVNITAEELSGGEYLLTHQITLH